MRKISSEGIERLQKMLEKDPKSKAFAALAEGYREMGLLDEAHKTASKGALNHPHYVGGHLVLGKIYIDQKKLIEAEKHLKLASELDPQNILALQMLGTVLVHLKKTKDALKAFKLALFLNPQNERAKKAVEKLETLLNRDLLDSSYDQKPIIETAPNMTLERDLALIDAYIDRQDFNKAMSLIFDLEKNYPNNSEVLLRKNKLSIQPTETIKPIASREKIIIKRKIQILETLLLKIRANHFHSQVGKT
jgi:tetratricopeptide (TPR) repeat protein